MEPSIYLELFGYLGSAMVVVSLLMSSVVRLRTLNIIGSVISGTYALLIGSFPLALMNFCLIVINGYHLKKLLVTRWEYKLVKCGSDDAVVGYFVNRYKDDIKVYFPGFETVLPQTDVVYMMFCEGDPAGVFLGRNVGDGVVEAEVEYSTPTYRDCSVGKFLYSVLPGEGVKEVIVSEVSEKHRPYLEKMHYQCSEGSYIRKLK